MSALSTLETVTEVMAEVLSVPQDELDMDADMESIGVDEMTQVIIAAELESEMSLKIPDIDLEGVTTGRQLVAYIDSRINK